ncbi:Predicted lipoprotein with conserved Yx(FWY)xxD motif [Tistlia consotensis]|uniref:Predicted lipoprotein with conserved Yx(FWY)xxD motif n=1 Tax=Tistlia consotensis USBA 355 TaxID=560819 RepID=A0A1Y6CQ05_9PROT|nr:hypothetical protein [Tistlia consotensis]SMF64763.1 Predicted lipoprotein with conserved Yx(FWY)xxD motif [Tistlia consotensis USBA 355]SNR96668.1 Predicted lipoprotein with conserved Yx(FWY)xxD motif [Tistlia consotensis]
MTSLRAAPALAAASILVAALVAGCAAPAFDAGGPGATRQTSAGKVLVDAHGMTLYVYDEDRDGRSSCTGLCAAAWPPAEAAPGARPHDGFSLVARGDGAMQWAYDGRPLYGYVGDTKPGEVNGDGAEGVWHAAHG